MTCVKSVSLGFAASNMERQGHSVHKNSLFNELNQKVDETEVNVDVCRASLRAPQWRVFYTRARALLTHVL